MTITETDETPTSLHRNGGAAVAETLQEHGVDTIFGIPGTHNLEIYRHLVRLGIRPVTHRHEQGAGYAADGYSQVAGKPGVVITTSGPGTLNAMVAAGTSYAESRPVLIISSGLPSGTEHLDGGELHETKDTLAAMASMTEWSTRATTPEEATEAIAHAFEVMRTGRPRPVYVEIPSDVLAQEWDGEVARAGDVLTPAVDESLVRQAALLLLGATRPAIIAGGGSRGADAQLRRLAERLTAPVISTCNGKGVLPEGHPLSLGANIRLRSAQDWLNASDALLVVGSELGDSDLWEGRITSPNVIRIDIAESQLALNAPARIAIRADAADALEAIDEAIDAVLGRHGAPADSAEPHMASRELDELKATLTVEALADGETWFELNSELRTALPADTIITGDSSQVTYFGTVHFFPVPNKNSFLYMPRVATLGYALPAAIGAKVARPDAPVIALLGDGALMFSVQELVTAVEQGLSIVVVVANNGGYREIRDQQAARGIAPVGVDLHVPDLVALANAIGATGERAENAQDAAARARAALGRRGPTVISLDFP
ncbi:acetolactate synthase-1/2/3 large subunit [Cryobacterium psychrotolerans]|uniref:Acetolactate synthase-1/2/3 large subunit n=1 Tax=Cryobacterium psychrotolerans TaxID=386301 RepID=A0A1G9G8L9_9MICO|nr:MULTISPECIES: thiamine pyrophosphate-dependent enzyme [Cryobacterium]TFD42356.1 acetolactate synthase [Cryobacterium sp. TMT1-2-1]TFD83830.1 acetolactate synthase [Cryobacterium psychrotolerans]SDK97039.1 acetolactate synthase-1/2/3 large subunit [Cryobacterium psychrotolerans]